MTLKESFRLLKKYKKYESTRWNKFTLTCKYIQYKLFAAKKTEFLLPGPTSKTHPYGFMGEGE